MKAPIRYPERKEIKHYQGKRKGEKHVADVMHIADGNLSLDANIARAKELGVRFVLVGIPEDIGPRANCGKGGADKGWTNFLEVFLNQQSNQYFDWQSCLLLGCVDVEDLQSQSYQVTYSDHKLDSLRQLVAQLDDRVEQVLRPIFEAGLEAIVIGGGHNNAYPIIKSLSVSEQQGVSCVNLDPHADFRPIEGRHSGNPFNYAWQQGYLNGYFIIGLHEQKNNQATLDGLKQSGSEFVTFQQLKTTGQVSFNQALVRASEYIQKKDALVGVELDLDSIKMAGASAYSVVGFSIEEAVMYCYQMAKSNACRYLHLCEGAPMLHDPVNPHSHDVGQMLTQLVYGYLRGRANAFQ